MNLVQRGDEEFVCILLGVSGEFGRCAPGGGQEGDGSIRIGVFRIYLLLRERGYSLFTMKIGVKSAYLSKEFIHFAACARFGLALFRIMFIA